MNYKDLADLIFPEAKDISYYEEKYPRRELKENAVVTRYAPSPTGVMHIGGLYQALIAKKIAKQTEGVFFVRIEDTDQKREIENGTQKDGRYIDKAEALEILKQKKKEFMVHINNLKEKIFIKHMQNI